MSIDLAIAAAIWGAAAFILPVPYRPTPPAPSLLFADDWPGDCARLHERAQTGMRTAFGVVSTAAGLASGILAFQPGAGSISLLFLVATVAIVLLTLVLAHV